MELLITAGFIFVLEDPERGQVCDYSGVHNVSTTNVSARTIPMEGKYHCVHEALAEGEQKIIVLGLPVFSIVCGDGVGAVVFM